jgi:hypothetical protein
MRKKMFAKNVLAKCTGKFAVNMFAKNVLEKCMGKFALKMFAKNVHVNMRENVRKKCPLCAKMCGKYAQKMF